MADPVLRLDTTRVAVEPGGQAQVVVTVTSSSSIVEGFALEVLGAEPSRWAEVVPPSVDVYPGSEATAVIVFSPPAGTAAPSGDFPFGLRARSTEDADVSAVVEGDVTLGKVSGLQAKIIPVTSSGRWRGRHVVQLSNWGNAAVRLQLSASDPDAALGYYLRPDLVELPIGASATVRLTVRTRKPVLRGAPARLPFQVVGEPPGDSPGPRPAIPYGDPSRPVVDAAFNQRPILSRTLVTVVALALVVGGAGGAYALTRHPPTAISLEQLGTPEKPKNFAVVATGPTALKASWTPMSQLTGYKLLDIDPATDAVQNPVVVDQSSGQKIIGDLVPDTEYCYRLQAVRESKVGPASEKACARTEKPPASPSPTPTGPSGTPATSTAPAVPPPGQSPAGQTPPASPPGSPGTSATGPAGSPGVDPFTGGAWVVVARVFPYSGSEIPAAAAVKTLGEQGYPNSAVRDSQLYPTLRLLPNTALQRSWLAVVGPFPTQVAAAAEAPKIQAITQQPPFVRQPDPPG